MTGLDRRIVSPSISSTRRSTPWVDGCCGPMFMIMRSPMPSAVGAWYPERSSASVSDMRSTASSPVSRCSAASRWEMSVAVIEVSRGNGV